MTARQPAVAVRTIYLADVLPARHPALYAALTAACHAANVPLALLPGTRDVWARDYMPTALPTGGLVQFRYAPDYLRGKKAQRSITNAAAVCHQLGFQTSACDLVVDGGNIVRGNNLVLMTDKVLRENAALPAQRVVRELAAALGVERVLLLPADPQDFTGHADGMVHFVDEKTVLVNDYRREEPALWAGMVAALRHAGLHALPFSYNPYRNRTAEDATGVYINFLRVASTILLPVFGMPEDEAAIRELEQVFPTDTIRAIPANELAPHGGLLHCITWVY